MQDRRQSGRDDPALVSPERGYCVGAMRDAPVERSFEEPLEGVLVEDRADMGHCCGGLRRRLIHEAVYRDQGGLRDEVELCRRAD